MNKKQKSWKTDQRKEALRQGPEGGQQVCEEDQGL